jgi:hypothetical protein
MLPGLNGHLISELFLESELSAASGLDSGTDSARRHLLRWRRTCDWLGPASGVQAVFEAAAVTLVETLGFERPTAVERLDSLLIGTIRCGAQNILLLVPAWGEPLDPLWRVAVTRATGRSATWSMLFNGTHIRIVDAERSYTRRFLEFDIDLALDDDRTFTAFWSLLQPSAFAGPGGDRICLHSLVEASERYASAVSKSLRDGVLAASGDVLCALLRPARRAVATAPPLDIAFEQALTIVYRILFLLFAEARGLVPLWHSVYRESYSVESLRSAAEGPQTAAGL